MSGLLPRGGWLQRLLFWLVQLFRPARRRQSTPAKRIGLLRFDKRMGEVLLQTPLFASIKRTWPDAEIVAIVHPAMRRVLEEQPNIDEIIPFSTRGFPLTLSSWKQFWALCGSHLDVAIDCANYALLSTSHAWATLLTGAPERIGFDRGGGSRDCYTTAVKPLGNTDSERLQRLHLLTALGIEFADEPLHYVPRDPLTPEVQMLLAEVEATPSAFAVINPGGRLGWRRVSPEILAAASRRLIERGRQPVAVWGPGEREIAVAHCAAVGPKARLAPPTDINGLAALMSAVGCTVTNNSGPMHLSAATGAPTLAVFLEMPAARWGYDQAPHMVVDISGLVDPESTIVAAVDRFLDNLDLLEPVS